MASYPEIPKFLKFENKDVKEFYNTLERWGSALINELTNRDRQIDTKPTTNIYTVVTISNVKRPRKGDIVYAVSSAKYKGYVSTATSTTWKNFF
jgi:hypothetical protein|tara:strand:+ start:165 stop:446 length:282 start_codon:yes stop_codon:yes gene_type:complete